MTDLPERLRDYINNTDDCAIRVEAADEIERLREANKRLEDSFIRSRGLEPIHTGAFFASDLENDDDQD